MKKTIIPLSLILLTLYACKGRTASVADSDGDTVEVVVNDPSATVDAASDSAFSVKPDADAEPTPRPDAVPAHTTESPAAAAGIHTPITPEAGSRQHQGDVSPGKAI